MIKILKYYIFRNQLLNPLLSLCCPRKSIIIKGTNHNYVDRFSFVYQMEYFDFKSSRNVGVSYTICVHLFLAFFADFFAED